MTDGAGSGAKLCAVSVDLDEIPFYFQIHGLTASSLAANAVFDTALDRLESWAASLSIPLTLFAIGATLERAENGPKLRRLAALGHEIGNHTLSHRYELTRLSRAEMEGEVVRAQDVIERACGVRPLGFRAPGYTVSDELLDVVAHAGFRYDSSVFPCPSYWALKAAAMALIRARGRRSHSILDTPRVLTAPTQPYRIGAPYWSRGDGLLELPVQVTRGLRLAFIGTWLTMAGPRGARQLTRMVLGDRLVNLELHGIDVLDANDGLSELSVHQPDVKVASTRKLETLTAVVHTLRDAGYRFVRLDEAARAFA
jgi:peptidoglycan/xylan/chitin deacetylase (PgdA/CDA1 family)